MKDLLNQEQYQGYQEYLYTRGYLIMNRKDMNLNDYPFHHNWKIIHLYHFDVLIHHRQKCFIYENGKRKHFLIGHCYNPFTKEHEELAIIKHLSEQSDEAYWNYLNQLTGNFITGFEDMHGRISFTCDATAMMSAFYGMAGDHFYISNYSYLIGEIANLKFDPYVENLVRYKHYHLFGRMLPGDMSAYQEIKHLIPNFQIQYQNGKVMKKRFWPIAAIRTDISQTEYETKIEQCASILHESLCVISVKWPEQAAISLTGGCDSKTTLACANGLYDRFKYFSYISSEAEKVDADAAKKIAESLNIIESYKTYLIPQTDEDVEDVGFWRKLLNQNCGEIGDNNANDIRKRAYFVKHHDFDVEVKSWVSEIARAYYNKRFLREKFPDRPTPRYLTAMYKVFFLERNLIHETDKRFQSYLDEYYSDEVFKKISWTDLIFWEYRVSSWNGLVISNEQSLSYDITIPYNNRILLQMLLGTPLKKRMNDECHKDIQKAMNRKIADSDISVTNLKHTANRARLERLYLSVQTSIPF